MFLCHVQLIFLGGLLFLKGKGRAVDLGKRGGGRSEKRGICGSDVVYERRRNFRKEMRSRKRVIVSQVPFSL